MAGPPMGGHGAAAASRRVGFHSAVDLEDLASSTASARVEALGTGPYQLLVVICVGVVFLCESLEMGAVAPLHSALARVFDFSDSERASLPAFTYAGSMAGLAIAGPVSDKWGRKVPVVLSLLLIVAVMLVTAFAPPETSPAILLALRFLSGLAGAIGGPAGLSLAVESCSGAARSKVVFAIMFLGSIGYLLEGIAIQAFMPDFGESDSDDHVRFCLFILAPAALALPLVLALRESPRFLAVRGNAEGCVRVLDTIAWWNGRPSELHQTIRVPRRRAASHTELGSCFEGGLLHSLVSTFSQRQHLWMLMMLLLVDSSRSFFVCGSSYLWKDLFSLHGEASMVSPSALNTITGVAPLVGLFVGDKIVRTFGVRRTCSVASLLAALSLVLLTSEGLREVPWMLLFLIMAVKLTYGPLATCVSLLKLEAFPTEVRASTFALVSMMGKLLALVAPTAAEVLRGGPSADDWDRANLLAYIGCLVGACVLTGAFVLLVDRGALEHAPLEDSDHLGDHRVVDVPLSDKVDRFSLGPPMDSRVSRCSSGYGSFFDIWAPGSPGTPSSRAGAFDNWMPRTPGSSPRTPVGAPPSIIHS